MKDFSLIFVILNVYSNTVHGIFSSFYGKIESLPIEENADVGEALFLTPYIKSGKIKEAQNAAQVKHPAFKNITHYTGFFTVNQTAKSNMFMWFFPSENKPESDPVILWLQGGPGFTSMYGLFMENGPFQMKDENEITLRKQSWTKHHNMLYIDSPVQTGFSFTAGDLARDQAQVSNDLYEALHQFFLLFPELRKNEFFIAGESYAGHFIPVLATEIRRKNLIVKANFQINLLGMTIGGGWVDPINQLEYGDYLYQHGLINSNMRKVFNEYKDKIIEFINQEEYADACAQCDNLYAQFLQISKFQNIFNYLYPSRDYVKSVFYTFVQKPDIRKALHVGNSKLHDYSDVSTALYDDIMKSYAHLLPELFRNYRVLLYNGQLDIVCAPPLTTNYLEKLNFDAADEYKNATRDTWFYNGEEIAGLVQVAGNLTELLLMKAGHLAITDQPDFAFDLIYRFTRNLKFD